MEVKVRVAMFEEVMVSVGWMVGLNRRAPNLSSRTSIKLYLLFWIGGRVFLASADWRLWYLASVVRLIGRRGGF
jgi:hypothetical protein